MNQDEDLKPIIDHMKLMDHFTLSIETEPIEYEKVYREDLGMLPGEVGIFQHEISREYVLDFEQVYSRELSIYLEKDKTLYESGFVEDEIEKITDLVVSVEAGLKNIRSNYIVKKAKNYILFLKEKLMKIEYEKSKTPNLAKPIIGKEYLTLIFKKYKDQFNEQEDPWNERFVYPNETPVNPIDIDKEAVNGSNRLVLIAILASIQNTTGNKFDFNKFVLDRFGLKNFEKAKTDHKEKKEFLDVVEACNRILKK